MLAFRHSVSMHLVCTCISHSVYYEYLSLNSQQLYHIFYKTGKSNSLRGHIPTAEHACVTRTVSRQNDNKVFWQGAIFKVGDDVRQVYVYYTLHWQIPEIYDAMHENALQK